MLWKSRILYDLCYAIMQCLQDMYVSQERKYKKEVTLKFKNFILDEDINHELCTMKCIPSYVKFVK
jgi:hypothetical protein